MSDVRPPTGDSQADEPARGWWSAARSWLLATFSGEEVPGVQRAEAPPLAPSASPAPPIATPELEHATVRYERTDTGFRWVVIAAAILVIFGCVEAVTIYIFFRYQQRTQAEAKRSPYPLATTPGDQLPAAPRLEPLDRTPPGDLAALARRDADKNRALGRYGTADDEDFVRVPIQRAIESLAGKLPVREAHDELVRDRGLVDSGEPNSGRLLRGGRE